jgi:hypothetical protein
MRFETASFSSIALPRIEQLRSLGPKPRPVPKHEVISSRSATSWFSGVHKIPADCLDTRPDAGIAGRTLAKPRAGRGGDGRDWVTAASAAGSRVPRKRLCRFDHTPGADIDRHCGSSDNVACCDENLSVCRPCPASIRHRRSQLDLVWPETKGRLTCVLRSARHSRSADLRCLP